ncbi:hypothetical protein [Rhizobium arsenicireducens]
MTTPENTNTNLRLGSLEQAIAHNTDRVGEVVKYMERLVVIEERNGFMLEQHRELKATFKEAIQTMTNQQLALDNKVRELQEKMIRLMTTFSILTTTVAIGIPYILKILSGA